MRRSPWLKRKKTAPELPFEPPIRLGNMSNGEFFHQSTAFEQRVRAEILRRSDEKARKLGMDRREFNSSAMGMATSLSVLNMAAACGSGRSSGKTVVDMGSGTRPPVQGYGQDAGSAFEDAGVPTTLEAGAAPSGLEAGVQGGDARVGALPQTTDAGGYAIPDAATTDCEMAEAILNGKGEFILDAQTHHLEREGEWRTTNPLLGDLSASFFSLYNGCLDWDSKTCVDAQAYLEKIFLESDTTLAVLSGFPTALCTEQRTSDCGNTLDNDAIWKSRDRLNMIAQSRRVINHCQVNPRTTCSSSSPSWSASRTSMAATGSSVTRSGGPMAAAGGSTIRAPAFR